MHLRDVGCFVHTFPFFALCNDMFAMHVCATHWLSMHSYTLAYMSMHESCLLVCRICFNIVKLRTFDPNLHLSLMDTTFCVFLLICLFVCLFGFLLVCLPCLSCLRFMPFRTLFASFPSTTLLVSCLCLCIYAHGARMRGARVRFPKHKQKGHGCKHVDMSQAVMFSRFRNLVFPTWLCTLLNPLPSSPFSLLDGYIRYIMPCTIHPYL